ncbi:hypothetical protein P4H42_07810 [Paenibacillus macerans]|uniref:hypothetical protein n=1 Tax=Paenibacillus macerans TaxID=44252 RepID=UPI002DBC3FA4|nr:hypothetical protein [Paenibacillus macerans]MEC0329526.1 hypothetical protein [Paenibacillus macerans]
MHQDRKEKLAPDSPDWLGKTLAFLSALLGAGAFWYTWYSYQDWMAGTGVPWYGWIRIAFMLLIGVFCLSAALLFIMGKRAGWSVFQTGLMLVPVMLASNLIIVIIRAVIGAFQGKTLPFFEKIISDPKSIAVPGIILALALLGALSKKDPKNEE